MLYESENEMKEEHLNDVSKKSQKIKKIDQNQEVADLTLPDLQAYLFN